MAASVLLAALACAESAAPPGAADAGPRRTITGATMGTTFAVIVVSREDGARARPLAGPSEDGARETDGLRAAVQERLDGIEERMSHYRSDSELSRFNRARTTEPWPMSRETLGVVAEALAVSRASGGAFDVTVGPLVDAWGFGAGGRAPAAPGAALLSGLRERVGSELLEVDRVAGTLRKRRPDVAIDLSAVAKGYAVDAVASLLVERGFRDYLVEIGGELRAGGGNEDGAAWRVAVERPLPASPGAQRVLPLADTAVATSGDYRNFYDLDGVRVSHTIDPRTGRPVTHRLRSVSVVARRCLLADARSTALHVLGPDEGYALAVEQGWAALFVADDGTGLLVERETPAFTAAVRRARERAAERSGGPPGADRAVGALTIRPDAPHDECGGGLAGRGRHRREG